MKRTLAIVTAAFLSHAAVGGEADPTPTFEVTVRADAQGILFQCAGEGECAGSYKCGESSSGSLVPSDSPITNPQYLEEDCKLTGTGNVARLSVFYPTKGIVPNHAQFPNSIALKGYPKGTTVKEAIAADRIIYVDAAKEVIREASYDSDGYAPDATSTEPRLAYEGEIRLFTTEEVGNNRLRRDDTFHTGTLEFECGHENPRDVSVQMSFTKDTVAADVPFGAGSGVWWLEWGGKVREGEVLLSGSGVQFPRSACAVEFLEWFRGRVRRNGQDLSNVQITAFNKVVPGDDENEQNILNCSSQEAECEHWFMHGARVREDDRGFRQTYDLFREALEGCVDQYRESVRYWDQDREECDPDKTDTSGMATPPPVTTRGDIDTYQPRRNR